ncbi:hypothetical protein C8J25_103357 [Sphingomonas faeni]|uniref:Uncharacterized protein n=2 Tax=Sphingomonas faeni TaxID=185950 RepID=A0A2T5U7Z2_9SPHN|nr:hypothetical protein C8J25_103357 [Sphingomonas faeni]
MLVDNEIVSLNEALSATGVKLSMREQRNSAMSNALPIFRISVGGNKDAFKHQYVAVLNRTHDGKLHVVYQNDRNPGSNPRVTFELVTTKDTEVGLMFNRLLELINED